MTKQTINIGTSANKGNGDPLRTAFTKVNDNFTELYAILSVDGTLPTASTTQAGVVRVDGTTIVIVNGVISATGSAPLVLDGGEAVTEFS